jgi:hypothetical protein
MTAPPSAADASTGRAGLRIRAAKLQAERKISGGFISRFHGRTIRFVEARGLPTSLARVMAAGATTALLGCLLTMATALAAMALCACCCALTVAMAAAFAIGVSIFIGTGMVGVLVCLGVTTSVVVASAVLSVAIVLEMIRSMYRFFSPLNRDSDTPADSNESVFELHPHAD